MSQRGVALGAVVGCHLRDTEGKDEMGRCCSHCCCCEKVSIIRSLRQFFPRVMTKGVVKREEGEIGIEGGNRRRTRV